MSTRTTTARSPSSGSGKHRKEEQRIQQLRRCLSAEDLREAELVRLHRLPQAN
ncbi:hypothetical protein QJ054_33060 [Streptomyces sp. AN-3]|uniref:hypothetical protein n=1 Tax=Streptomyces sp. AN-3 TaxID=3044177 RepID=UPI00249A0551|nr:hypothetical protein [Streptomyces sp. AN-3]MDI3101876.1 hypothetical protein [Streptomyces sp. AN-3]